MTASLLLQPSIGNAFERLSVDAVKLVSTLSAGFDQAGGLQHIEVLRDRLPRRAEPILVRQACADLKQGLPIPFGQLIEDLSPRWIRQGLEDVVQRGKVYASSHLHVNSTPSRLAGKGLGRGLLIPRRAVVDPPHSPARGRAHTYLLRVFPATGHEG